MSSFAPSPRDLGGQALPSAYRQPAAGLPSLVADNASALVSTANRTVVEHGHRVGGERPFLELLNQQLCQTEPRRRVFAIRGGTFNVAVAVARFVWHLAGSSELAAIAFYEPRAHLFSDDGEILPGSNTGARIFGADSGIDQLQGIVTRIRADASSRRGAAVVWRPEDAVRESQDIPCTMAMTCHLRAGRLFTTVNMRSNNALRLLPYNLFEFTMLAELIAAELNVELGPYWHAVSSLHVFESELDPAVSIYSSPEDPAAEAKRMVEMPRGRGIFEEAAALVESEARLRANVVARDWASLAELVKQAEEELPPYWFGLFSVLALFSAARANALDEIDADLLRDSLPAALRGPLLALLA